MTDLNHIDFELIVSHREQDEHSNDLLSERIST